MLESVLNADIKKLRQLLSLCGFNVLSRGDDEIREAVSICIESGEIDESEVITLL